MTKTAKNQTLVTTWGRFVLGAFVFAWLNVSAQPCFMAMEMVMESEVLTAHDGDGQQGTDQQAVNEMRAGDDCDHCPLSGTSAHQNNCATMQAADCGALPESNVEARSVKLKLKDAPGEFAIAQAPPRIVIDRQVSNSAPRLCEPRRYSAGPSLNLRYCVFLK